MTLQEDIRHLRSKGKTYDQIVAELSCSKGTVSYYLGVQQKEKTLKRQRDRRNKKRIFLSEYKQKRGCVDCKIMYPYWVLQFDHCRGEDKVSNVTEMVTDYSMEEIMQEIAKCDVVCANCHSHRTWMRRTKSLGNISIGSTIRELATETPC